MILFGFIVFLLALVLAFLAMLGIPSSPRFNLLAGALFCYFLSLLLLKAIPLPT